MLLPEYTNNVLVHCMQKSSHRQQEVCKKDLKQKKWIGNSCIVISLLLVHPQTHFFAPHYFFECDGNATTQEQVQSVRMAMMREKKN